VDDRREQTINAVQLHVLLWAAAMAGLAGAAEAPLHFDRQQVIERASAQVRSEFAKYPQAALPGVDYGHPVITAVRAQSQRAFVVVSFASALASWGAYVIFEQCGKSVRVVPSGSGRVIDIGIFRETVSKIGPTTRLALPDACAAGGS
jgi:hypothetical protein